MSGPRHHSVLLVKTALAILYSLLLAAAQGVFTLPIATACEATQAGCACQECQCQSCVEEGIPASPLAPAAPGSRTFHNEFQAPAGLLSPAFGLPPPIASDRPLLPSFVLPVSDVPLYLRHRAQLL